MAVRYRRQSNVIGWLAFCGIGALVFIGLLGALYVLKQKQEKVDQGLAAATTGQGQPKAQDIVRNFLKTKVYNGPKDRYQIEGMTTPKEVLSKKNGHKVIIVRVRHMPLTDDGPGELVDQVLVIDKLAITPIVWEEWDKNKDALGIDEDP